MFVRPLPPREARHSGRLPECTTNTLAPGLDGAITGWQVIRTVVALNASDEEYRDARFSRRAEITSGILFGLLALSSAIYGFHSTSECRKSLGMEFGPPARTRPHSRDVTAEIAEEKAAQARAAAQAAEQAKAAGEAAQRSRPAAKPPDAPR